ncbi:sigma-70 family RNA polymerase sigma factor [bacterium]|nr:sigma-70 family RNA polymerase sigma factor [bacterium]
MAQITLGGLENNPNLLHQFIKENTRPMIQRCVCNFKKINEEDAEDLVQNALLKLIEIITERKVQKKDTPAIAWMYQELKWRCIDLGREKEKVVPGEWVREKERKKEAVISSAEYENKIDILPHLASIESEIIQREIYQFLRECIETKMKGRRREIFQLYLVGYIAAEIAQKLGVTRAFVSKETKIGCQNLRRLLQQRGFD